MTNLTVKKRGVPLQMHIFNFYGDLKVGYFKLNGKFLCNACSLDSTRDIIWVLLIGKGKGFSSGRMLAWPNFRGQTKVNDSWFTPLEYCEFQRKD
jgi:hypothetical protein